jgi:hypothetical protein
MSDFHVVKVLPRGRVIIDARQLRRVIDTKTGEALMELMPQDHAELAAETFNYCTRSKRAIVVPYKAAKPSRRRAFR